MSSKHPFKIILVGGGVAGLALANMLEKFDIDYVLLESHAEIAPPVGASIGLFPNGLLVLDQLGCYEAVRKVSQAGEVGRAHIRDHNGKSITSTENMLSHLEKRHGYPMLFFDRQWLLQVLYDQVKQKGKILINKKVQKIIPASQGVEVQTADGDVYFGSLVIGGDGIHSTVRREMRRIAEKASPGYFPPGEEDRVPCYYKCSFGIAQNVSGWPQGEQCFTTGHGRSFLVASGSDKRVYWFLFVRLPEVKYGKAIPRYTDEDEKRFISENRNLHITETVTLGQVYDKRLTSTLTPLHEVVFKKWFFDRIALIGDSVHKPNPIGGMGGNGAIETAAEFVNILIEARDKRPGGLDSLSTADIRAVFQEMQSRRFTRSEFIIEAAHKQQALFASENPAVSNFVWNVAIPLGGDESPLERLANSIVGGTRLATLPVPYRPRVIPYECELPAKPLRSGPALIPRGVFLAGSALVVYVTFKAFRLPFVETWGELAPLGRNWIGGGVLNRFLNYLTSVISFVTLSPDPAARLHLAYFLTQLISPLLIYTIEGYRAGNRGTLLALPSVFTAGMQVQGIGRIAPLYGILSAFQARENPADRVVQPEVAKALLPALVLGYIVPTAMLLAPIANTRNRQNWTALWQFAPPLFSALTAVFSSGLRLWQQRRQRGEEPPKPTASPANRNPQPGNTPQANGDPKPAGDDKADPPSIVARYRNDDVPILKSVYTFAFAAQAAAHVATLAYAWSHPLPLSEVFLSLPSPFRRGWALPSAAAQIAVFFRYDMVTAVAGLALHQLYSVWSLRRQGYVTTLSAAKAAVAVTLGQVLVGPGATWAGLWGWRESVIDGLSLR